MTTRNNSQPRRKGGTGKWDCVQSLVYLILPVTGTRERVAHRERNRYVVVVVVILVIEEEMKTRGEVDILVCFLDFVLVVASSVDSPRPHHFN